MRRDGERVGAGGDRPVVLQAASQPLDAVVLAIGLPIEGALPWLVRPPWDHRADAPASQEAAHGSTAGARVARHRSGRRRARPRPRRLTAPLSNRVGSAVCSWRSPPVRQNVLGLPRPSARGDLRGATAMTASQGLVRPLLAPAACGWARTTLPSTKWIVPSRFPSASASACSSARIRRWSAFGRLTRG